VRPEVVGICGSDLHLFSGELGALSGARDFYPRIQGHELSAVVESVGEGCPPGIRPGERVAVWPLLPCGRCYPCRVGRPNACVSLRLVGVHVDGGLQQRLALPASQIFGVGDLDLSCAAFVEPLSIAVHALGRGLFHAGQQIAVFGAGPIGLATVIVAAGAGARVMAIDPVASRRDLAAKMGAERVVWGTPDELADTAREWTGGEGPPLILDTTGDAAVLPRATDMVCSAGRIVVVGMSAATAPLRSGVFPEKEIEVVGSSCATADDFAGAVRIVAANRDLVFALFSHRFPLSQVGKAIEFTMNRPSDVVKVLVTITGDPP
jgi:threonine dehydrogenase-like Zn-dependent dehydrogenase